MKIMPGCFHITMKLTAAIYSTAFSNLCEHDIVLSSNGESLCMCEWNIPERIQASVRRLDATLEYGNDDILKSAAAQLDEYFTGRRKIFTLPLMIVGSPFMKRVWDACSSVPYGSTATYSDISRTLGMKMAARAVGNALGANSLSLFIPCHRIVAASGSGNYAGGSDTKLQLLNFENSHHYDLS